MYSSNPSHIHTLLFWRVLRARLIESVPGLYRRAIICYTTALVAANSEAYMKLNVNSSIVRTIPVLKFNGGWTPGPGGKYPVSDD